MSRRRTHGARLLAGTPEPVLPADLPSVEEPRAALAGPEPIPSDLPGIEQPQPEPALPQAPATESLPAPPGERPGPILAEVGLEGGEWRLIPRFDPRLGAFVTPKPPSVSRSHGGAAVRSTAAARVAAFDRPRPRAVRVRANPQACLWVNRRSRRRR